MRLSSFSALSCWGCRIHGLNLTPLPTSVLDMTLNHWWWGSNLADLEVVEYPFIAIAPRSTLTRSGSTWLAPMCASNRTKLRTYAKLNDLNKQRAIKWLMLNCDCYIATLETSQLWAKKSTCSFKNVINKMCVYIYICINRVWN